jgi:hypothetical protein
VKALRIVSLALLLWLTVPFMFLGVLWMRAWGLPKDERHDN